MHAIRAALAEGVRVSGIMAVGDLLAQTVIDKKRLENIDVRRTCKFAAIGLLFVGPTLRVWYQTLEKVVNPGQPAFRRALKKMSLDQLLFAPVFTLALTAVVGTVNGETPKRIKQRIDKDYLTIMQRNYMLWPAAQMFNFSMVPIQYQVIFAQVVAIIWNCYLSMMFNSKKI